ncbi:acetyl-CoA-benzylalcohol acetyltransferase-like [Solanum pennellii]|uniref:AT3 n=1 Tax=Solanum pennellii TaxID=28526 RepID=I6TFB6_SOLPN|nr:acetyl-CoA-benzylalcohol acetyltransferase-like [Solanum pennellii]AFM77973.1 AT3 [Solanum pennellii]
MAKLDIEIQTRKMLKPSAPTPDNLRRLKISLFDQLARSAYVPMLFNYLPNSTSSYDHNDDKLEKSLAETLTKFYPFAGRFAKDDPFSIDCNDEGVEYVQTKVNADDLAQFLGKDDDIESSLIDLLPIKDVEPSSPSSPLFGVQVNVFNNGGVTIGIQISHIVADAFTLATFVNEWAHTNTLSSMPQDNNYLHKFGELSSLFPPKMLQLPSFDPNTSSTTTGTTVPNYKNVTKRFVFDALAIENLKKTIKDDSSMIRQPTKLVVVMSLLWKVLARISCAKNGNSRDSTFGFVISYRGKVSCIPSTEHVLGTFSIPEIANMEGDVARKDELNDFVKLVGNRIGDTFAAIDKASKVDDIYSLTLNNQIKIIDKLLQRDKIDIYGTTSWCKLPWYEADFGWGKPFWVTPVSFGIHELTILMDTKDGNGIEIIVTMKENDMTEFERDPHILSSTSKLTFHSFG